MVLGFETIDAALYEKTGLKASQWLFCMILSTFNIVFYASSFARSASTAATLSLCDCFLSVREPTLMSDCIRTTPR